MVAVVPPGHAMDLNSRFEHLARSPRLLVACDYDGTLAPLVDDPAKAFPRRETVVAIRALAELPQTSVAVISGRALRDLATLSRLPEEIRLVGSHGGEFDVDFVRGLDAERRAVLDQIMAGVHVIVADYPGAFIEPKPAGLALHLRRFEGKGAAEAVARVTELAASHDGVGVRHGHEVVELSVVDTDKGRALELIRSQVGASAVVFIGDDRTDEDAFLWPEGEPDYARLLAAAGAELSAASSSDPAAERRAFQKVEARLLNELHLPAVKEAASNSLTTAPDQPRPVSWCG